MADTPTDSQPDPLEELVRTKEENKKILEEIRQEREKVQKMVGNAILAGKSTVKEEKKEPPKPLTNREYATLLSKGIIPKDN